MKQKVFVAGIELDEEEITDLIAGIFGVGEEDVELLIVAKNDEELIKCRVNKKIKIPESPPTITVRDPVVNPVTIPDPTGDPFRPYVSWHADPMKEPLDLHSTTGADPFLRDI